MTWYPHTSWCAVTHSCVTWRDTTHKETYNSHEMLLFCRWCGTFISDEVPWLIRRWHDLTLHIRRDLYLKSKCHSFIGDMMHLYVWWCAVTHSYGTWHDTTYIETYDWMRNGIRSWVMWHAHTWWCPVTHWYVTWSDIRILVQRRVCVCVCMCVCERERERETWQF